MSGTAAIVVVLIFVATLFSSMHSNQGYSPRADIPGDRPPAAEIALPEAPDPTYIESATGSYYEPLKNYITKYRSVDQAGEISASIIKYSKQYNVNPKLVAALMERESRFNPQSVSSSGAVGLGQLLPSTCTTVGITDPRDIDQNAKGTVRYLNYLLDRFKGRSDRVAVAIAAYLVGPNAVASVSSLDSHTAGYIRDILNNYYKI